MKVSEDAIKALFDAWREHYWPTKLRFQFTAGWGCTVLEIFVRGQDGPQIPLQRIIL